MLRVSFQRIIIRFRKVISTFTSYRSIAWCACRRKGLIYVNFTTTKRVLRARLLHLAKGNATAIGTQH